MKAIIFAGVAAVLVIAYFLLVRAGWRRSLRVTVTVKIPPFGEPSVTFTPPDASDEDLVRMCLHYGCKLRWCLLTESEEVQGLFKELTSEAIRCWLDGEGPLLAMMTPIGERLSSDSVTAAAVPKGETYVVRYFRSPQPHLSNKPYVRNWLPVRRLNINYAWNYLLILGAVHDRLGPDARGNAEWALVRWWQLAFDEWVPDQSLKGLRQFAPAADQAWEDRS